MTNLFNIIKIGTMFIISGSANGLQRYEINKEYLSEKGMKITSMNAITDAYDNFNSVSAVSLIVGLGGFVIEDSRTRAIYFTIIGLCEV